MRQFDSNFGKVEAFLAKLPPQTRLCIGSLATVRQLMRYELPGQIEETDKGTLLRCSISGRIITPYGIELHATSQDQDQGPGRLDRIYAVSISEIMRLILFHKLITNNREFKVHPQPPFELGIHIDTACGLSGAMSRISASDAMKVIATLTQTTAYSSESAEKVGNGKGRDWWRSATPAVHDYANSYQLLAKSLLTGNLRRSIMDAMIAAVLRGDADRLGEVSEKLSAIVWRFFGAAPVSWNIKLALAMASTQEQFLIMPQVTAHDVVKWRNDKREYSAEKRGRKPIKDQPLSPQAIYAWVRKQMEIFLDIGGNDPYLRQEPRSSRQAGWSTPNKGYKRENDLVMATAKLKGSIWPLADLYGFKGMDDLARKYGVYEELPDRDQVFTNYVMTTLNTYIYHGGQGEEVTAMQSSMTEEAIYDAMQSIRARYQELMPCSVETFPVIDPRPF